MSKKISAKLGDFFRAIAVAVGIIFGSLTPAAAAQKPFPPNTFTWANPIYYEGSGPGDDIHDPDILNDGGVYYCVATLAPFRNYTDRDPKLPDLGSSPGISL